MMRTQHIWESYQRDIKQFILSKVRNEDIANDILQETFIKVHVKIDTLKNPDKLKPWVFSIANNTVLDYFKQSSASREYIEKDYLHHDERSQHDEKDCLHGIIRRLPKRYRDPLFLADIKGMKQADIARQLKLQLSTAKSRIQRARKQIAQGYMECCDFNLNQKGFLVGEVKDKADCKICS